MAWLVSLVSLLLSNSPTNSPLVLNSKNYYNLLLIFNTVESWRVGELFLIFFERAVEGGGGVPPHHHYFFAINKKHLVSSPTLPEPHFHIITKKKLNISID